MGGRDVDLVALEVARGELRQSVVVLDPQDLDGWQRRFGHSYRIRRYGPKQQVNG